MKIMTILGTRPEIIRLSRIIPLLDRYYDHILVHTGQNFTDSLNTIFFQDLELRKPDYFLGVQGETFAEQIGQTISESEKVMAKERPDRILILGDTNSGLSAIIARRMGIPVFHMEAGNRCFDDRVAEEINRRVIDHCSSIFMPYTHRSKENLLREGIPIEKIYVIGNPIHEVISYYSDKIKESAILSRLNLRPQQYILVTMHRAENVDDRDRLEGLLTGLAHIYRKVRSASYLQPAPPDGKQD